jgi:SAM-dependent methyltransferase
VEPEQRRSAERTRAELERALHTPESFRQALLRVTPLARDAWVDAALGLARPPDGPDLPRGCVPYLPCAVDALLRTLEQANVESTDVFVDVGSGAGRTAALVHLLTGASVIGLEIQRALAERARELAARLRLSRVAVIEGDAAARLDVATRGSVFFLYCPFSGERLRRFLTALEPVARARALRVCSVDLPLPALPWLVLEPQRHGDVAIHRTTLHSAPPRGA